MFIDTERSLELFDKDVLYEATTAKTYIFKTVVAPKVEKVLSTPEGCRKFSNLVSTYVNINNFKLMTPGPQYQIIISEEEKKKYYDLFDITEAEIMKLINTATKQINEKASWRIMTQNPIFVLFYYVIRFFTIKKESKQLNNVLIITALESYRLIFKKYYPYEPNSGVMQYTIDNLSKRFIIKKSNHIFGTLMYSIQNSWKFHESFFNDGCDTECVRFIQRIRNDQNSLLKKITSNYMDNYKKGLTIQTSVDSYDDNIVVDNENDSNKVESATNKIVLQILVNGINLKICDFAANASSISKIELRNYLTKILVQKNSDDMKSFIESILFLYLYDEKHVFQEVNSKVFLSFALSTFKKTNSKNENIINIKNLLNKWGEDSGIYGHFDRLATRVNYTKGIFLYFILSIQKYA